MKKHIIFLSLIITFTSYATEEIDYWKDTDLSFNILELDVLNNTVCHASEKLFVGCIAALNQLLQFSESQTRILLTSSHDLINKAQPVKSLGLVKIMDLQGSKALSVTEVRKQKENYFNTWTNLYKQGQVKDLDLKNLFTEAKQSIRSHFSEQKMVGLAWNQFLQESTDPHTYLSPNGYVQNAKQSLQKSYNGIGADLVRVEAGLLIIKTTPQGGADLAGLQRNDIVTAIDHKSTLLMTNEQALALLLGPANTTIELDIVREDQSLTLTVHRTKINKQRIEFKFLPYNEKEVGYFRLSSFELSDSCVAFAEALTQVMKNDKALGLVLDIRGNPGGSSKVVSCMFSFLLPAGKTIMTVRRGQSVNAIFYEEKTGLPSIEEYEKIKDKLSFQIPSERFLYNKPFVVLVDGASASASEIVSGVVQDYGIGLVVGSRTRGKGTFQTREPHEVFKNLQTSTTGGRFFLPSGRSNQLVGIIPDIEAYRSMSPTHREKTFLREEDSFRNSLPAYTEIKAPPNPLLRPVQMCLQQNGQAIQSYNPQKEFDVLTALDAIACLDDLKKQN